MILPILPLRQPVSLKHRSKAVACQPRDSINSASAITQPERSYYYDNIRSNLFVCLWSIFSMNDWRSFERTCYITVMIQSACSANKKTISSPKYIAHVLPFPRMVSIPPLLKYITKKRIPWTRLVGSLIFHAWFLTSWRAIISLI